MSDTMGSLAATDEYDPFAAEKFVNPAVGPMIGSILSLPQRAIENSQYSLDTGNYDPGPTLEAATLPMGTGAIAGVPVRAGEAVLGAGPIRAYHGSPHDFDAFDLSKIGTGEGAQAYGHGLYFADSENVAKSYRDALAGKNDTLTNRAILDKFGGDGKKAAEYLRGQAPEGSALAKHYEDVAQKMETGAPLKGRMYEVNINADPAHFLDWDKPLTQQSPTVQEAAKQAMGPNWDQFKYANAGDAVKQGFLAPGADTTAAALHNAGIPGIKYLDQGSRGAGQGSSNYVVFNDKLIDIMRKYGLAGAIGAGGMGALAAQDEYR